MTAESLIALMEKAKHNLPSTANNYPRAIGFNEGIDAAIEIIRQHQDNQYTNISHEAKPDAKCPSVFSSEIPGADAAADKFISEARISAYGPKYCSNILEGDFGSWEDWRKHFIKHYPKPVSSVQLWKIFCTNGSGKHAMECVLDAAGITYVD